MKRELNIVGDPLVKEIRKARAAHKKSPAGQLDALLAEESRWKRKRTIAENKLAEVRLRINRLAFETLNPKEPGKE